MKRHRWTRTCLLQPIAVALGLSAWTPLSLHAQTPPEILVETKLVAADGIAADQFGAALAVSDGVLVASAPSAVVDGKQFAGTAYIFLRDPTTAAWTEQKKLLSQDGAAFDQFGTVVAIDGETVVIGTPNATVNGAFQQGAVYIFGRHQGGTDNWGQVAKLTDDTVGPGGHFGSAVAIKGDLLVVGASEASTRHGRVTVFERNRGGADAWGAVTTISYAAVGDAGNVVSFGTGVAPDGDMLLVGAARTSVSYWGEADGAAYLFRRNADDADRWDFVTRLITPGADRCVNGLTLTEAISQSPEFLAEARRCAKEDSQTDNDNFGNAVALAGDVVVVGARFAEGVNATFSNGAAYVFQRDPAAPDRWTYIAKLAPADTSAFAYFGSALALADDTIVVGANGAAIGDKIGQGAAYVFKRNTGGVGAWGEVEKLLASDGLSNGQFGTAVAFDGQATLIGADGADGWRGAVYRHEPATEPPPPDVCQPPFALTGELTNDSVVSDPSGVLLGAVDNTLAKPLQVWIHEVPAPTEALFAGAAPLGAFYNIGAECTTFAPRQTPFVAALPVPEGTDASSLGAAALVSAKYMLDGPTSGEFWQPLAGTYDPDRRLYFVALGALTGEGSTIVLVGRSDLQPTPPAGDKRRRGRLGAATGEDNITFAVDCIGFVDPDIQQKLCGLEQIQAVRDALITAYNKYKRHGFPTPALYNKEISLNDDGKFEISEDLLLFEGIYIRQRDDACADYAGFYTQARYEYIIGAGTITFCVDPDGFPSPELLNTYAHHELFHAVQHSYTNSFSTTSYDWVTEGTAEAAVASDTEMHRTPTRDPRPVNVPLTSPTGAPGTAGRFYPYQAQDFWVYLFQANHRALPLSELGSFLERGRSTESVAQVLASPPSTFYFGLGGEYWGWVKNQVLEKTVDFDGALQNPCVLEHSRFDKSGKGGAYMSWPASDHVFGSLEGLQAMLVTIEFTTAANNVTITAEGGGGENVLAYKVFRDGEPDCADPIKSPDGKREFESVAQGDLVYVLLADMQYDGQAAAPLFEVRVIPSE
ncbi:MAG: FG-GAP repeat protein [Stellaceae bacterium]